MRLLNMTLLTVFSAIVLSGCSGLAAITVADTTYSTGIFIDKEKEVELD